MVLNDIARAMVLPHRDVVRAQTILLLADGVSQSEVFIEEWNEIAHPFA